MRRPIFLAGLSGTIAALSAVRAARAQQIPANAPPVTAGDQVYRVFGDVVTSGEGAPGIQGALCVNQTVFFPGDVLVFRAVIADAASGTPLSAADIAQRGVTANVALSDGTQIPLTLKSHPPSPAAPVHNLYWTGSKRIPPDHPTGTLKWTLTVADKAGHTTSFVPMGQENGATVLTIAQKAAAPAQR